MDLSKDLSVQVGDFVVLSSESKKYFLGKGTLVRLEPLTCVVQLQYGEQLQVSIYI
jgi:hypothetical protein